MLFFFLSRGQKSLLRGQHYKKMLVLKLNLLPKFFDSSKEATDKKSTNPSELRPLCHH